MISGTKLQKENCLSWWTPWSLHVLAVALCWTFRQCKCLRPATERSLHFRTQFRHCNWTPLAPGSLGREVWYRGHTTRRRRLSRSITSNTAQGSTPTITDHMENWLNPPCITVIPLRNIQVFKCHSAPTTTLLHPLHPLLTRFHSIHPPSMYLCILTTPVYQHNTGQGLKRLTSPVN